MADARGRFKRPEPSYAPVIGPDAERFVRGVTESQTTNETTAQATTGQDTADEVAAKTKKADSMKRLTIDIPESLHKRVKSQCANQGTTIADVVRHYLEKKFPEPKP